jgi:hypothetical protein
MGMGVTFHCIHKNGPKGHSRAFCVIASTIAQDNAHLKQFVFNVCVWQRRIGFLAKTAATRLNEIRIRLQIKTKKKHRRPAAAAAACIRTRDRAGGS